MALGEYDRAADCFKQITGYIPHDPTIRFQYALALGMLENFAESIEQFHQAINLEPDSEFLHFRLGDLYRSQKMVDEAIDEYEFVLRITNDPAIASLRLAEMYLEKGIMDKADAHLSVALQLKSDSPDVQEVAGRYHDKRKEAAAAIDAYRKAFAGNMTLYRLGFLLSRSEAESDRAEGENILKRHRILEPWLPHIYRTKQEIDVSPGDPRLMTRMAAFLNSAQEYAHGVVWIQRSLHRDPSQPSTHVQAGYLAANTNELARALQHFQEAQRLLGEEQNDTIQSYIDMLQGGEPLPLPLGG
jgi:tetratricopeptide (TPR) repeat protein